MAGGPGRGAHLLEVGLRWPPETFLQWKLERLSAIGFRVTVASTGPRARGRQRVGGVTLVPVPDWDEAPARKLLGVVADGLALLFTSPARMSRLVKEVRTPPPPDGPPSWREVIGSLRAYLRLARLKPDIVHFEWEPAAVYYRPLFEVWDRPIVMSCHGLLHTAPHGELHRRWLGRLPATLADAASVWCASATLRETAIEHGAQREQTVLVRPAVDPDLFRPSDLPTGDRGVFRVLAVGRLIWVKGYEYALVAIARLVELGVPVHLDVVGGDPPLENPEPSDRRRILRCIDDLGLRDHVVVHGELDSLEVRDLLARADAFVNSSVSEGVPTAVLEAMSCGVPVVVSDCGGLREAVRDGTDGVVVPARDADAIAAALAGLWADAGLRAALGAAGRARVEDAFALGQQVDRMARLYGELCSDRQGGREASRAAA